MPEPLTEEEQQEAGSIKYRGITTIAISSGKLCVLGHFSNIDGLPVLAAFGPDEWNELFALIYNEQHKDPTPSFRNISNERLGTNKRRSLVNVSLDDLGL